MFSRDFCTLGSEVEKPKMLGCVLLWLWLWHNLELVNTHHFNDFFTLRTSAQARDEDIKKIVKSLCAQ